MTFEEWWRANEHRLNDEYHNGEQWMNIHGLLREAWNARLTEEGSR